LTGWRARIAPPCRVEAGRRGTRKNPSRTLNGRCRTGTPGRDRRGACGDPTRGCRCSPLGRGSTVPIPWFARGSSSVTGGSIFRGRQKMRFSERTSTYRWLGLGETPTAPLVERRGGSPSAFSRPYSTTRVSKVGETIEGSRMGAVVPAATRLPSRDTSRASVGSREASESLCARVGVVRPKRATRLSVSRVDLVSSRLTRPCGSGAGSLKGDGSVPASGPFLSRISRHGVGRFRRPAHWAWG
jgi:hypothetical protein